MYPPPPDHLAALRSAAPGAEIHVATDLDSAATLIEEATAVLGNRFFLESLPHARRLRWMQSASAGVDRIQREAGPRLSGVTLTNCRGVYDDEVADHALALLLAFVRRLPEAFALRARREWQRTPLTHLRGRRALVLGWGGVGVAIARRLAACGVDVEGVRRRHAGTPAAGAEGFPVHGPHTWRARLPETDILVMALPATAETVRLVGRTELASLPSRAVVVNVGRGETLDEVALRDALDDGAIAGAALDVFDREPLPAEHWLWDAGNVVLTPHWGRTIEAGPWRWQPLFEENLRRFHSGRALLNVVDRDAGY
jgi:phosphoglycerate dehydrogenase-like enzyme